ncbi:MAG: polysaccharide deacetylase family protein [Lysobacter sp.]
MTMVPILMYHGLHDSPHSAGRFDSVYSVTPAAFARQLDWLRANGYAAVGLEQALDDAAQGSPACEVVISFDDGDVSNIEVALPMLRERGMHAEFFITTDFIDQPGMLSAADVRTLAEAGMGIGSHGTSHAFLEDLDEPQLLAELQDSRQRLQSITGQPVSALALPGGRGGDRERRLALALGYRHLLGSVPGVNRRREGDWLERIAVTRDLDLPDFGRRVTWRGMRPRLLQVRHQALGVTKRVLGNAGYERLRERLL